MRIESYKNLIVWQKAIIVAEKVYRVTKEMPKDETFGLISQMRRASVSIASNIAEGRSRSTRKDFSQFLRISLGSCAELETQIIIAKKTMILTANTEEIEILLTEISKILQTMVNKLAPRS